jgi:hypothetical protein
VFSTFPRSRATRLVTKFTTWHQQQPNGGGSRVWSMRAGQLRKRPQEAGFASRLCDHTVSTHTLMPSRPAKMMKLPDSSKMTFGIGACDNGHAQRDQTSN